MSKKIGEILAVIAKSMSARFYLNEKFIAHNEVFADDGMLPGIAKRADQLASLCLGYGLGISFEDAEGSLMGNKVIFDEVTPNGLRIMFMVDVLEELRKSGPSLDKTPMDELMYD